MVRYLEKRADERNVYKSPIMIEDLKGIIYKARMVNYCRNGLYFETDWRLQPQAEIYIEMENSPYTSSTFDLHERYRAQIRWYDKLDDSFFTYCYGARYVGDSEVHNGQSIGLRDFENDSDDSRKYPRKPYQKSVFFTYQNQYYKGLIHNISSGGIFINTKDSFSIGQMIRLVIPGTKVDKGVMLKAEVKHLNYNGIGVAFKSILKAKYNAEASVNQ